MFLLNGVALTDKSARKIGDSLIIVLSVYWVMHFLRPSFFVYEINTCPYGVIVHVNGILTSITLPYASKIFLTLLSVSSAIS